MPAAKNLPEELLEMERKNVFSFIIYIKP